MTKEEACVNAIEDLAAFFRTSYTFEEAVYYIRGVVRSAVKGNYERETDGSDSLS